MAITEKQRVARRRFIGSSDAAAVLGLDHFTSPMDVFLEKTGQIKTTGLPDTNDARIVGTYAESAILDWFEDTQGLELKRNQRRVHSNGIMAANYDALVIGKPAAVEAKTHGITTGWITAEWGEEGTNEVPDEIAIQCQHQMAVLPKLEVVYVPVLLVGVGFRRYVVERDASVISDLTQVCETFWNDHVLKGIPPEESEPPHLSILRKLKREPNKVVVLTDELVSNWLEAKDLVAEAKDLYEERERELLAALQDAEAGQSSLGLVTFFLYSRIGHVVHSSEYRSLKFKRAKEKKYGTGS